MSEVRTKTILNSTQQRTCHADADCVCIQWDPFDRPGEGMEMNDEMAPTTGDIL